MPGKGRGGLTEKHGKAPWKLLFCKPLKNKLKAGAEGSYPPGQTLLLLEVIGQEAKFSVPGMRSPDIDQQQEASKNSLEQIEKDEIKQ